ncbi:MAG TPA: hypothetical protein VHL09_00395, partial [Dehalococcoidia bacterium]|nr:hypothetical protein [Dehalococcoidia bacterium]
FQSWPAISRICFDVFNYNWLDINCESRGLHRDDRAKKHNHAEKAGQGQPWTPDSHEILSCHRYRRSAGPGAPGKAMLTPRLSDGCRP